MTTITYRDLRAIADEAGIDHDNIRTDYSGRGMYGRQCIAFDLDSAAQLLDLGAAVQTEQGADMLDLFTTAARTDSMGRSGIVVYFPGLTCDDAPEEDDPWDGYEDPDDDTDDDS